MATLDIAPIANSLLTELTGDAEFVIPNLDFSNITFPDEALNTPVVPLTIESITNGDVSGPGIFDSLMRGFKAHLTVEFDAGRITGSDYTTAYIALTEAAMSQGITFLLGKDQAFWQAQSTQVQAFIARVQLEQTKIAAVATQYNAANEKAAYALTKAKVATEGSTYDTAEFNLSSILPMQKQLLTKQMDGQGITNSTATYNLSSVLPQQLVNLQAQQKLYLEQMEAQRGQTHDMRSDNFPVAGVMGKQKALYSQQVVSYQRDAEVKAAKLFTDGWITQKTIDEGLTPPNGFTNASVDMVLTALKKNNGFTGV